MFLMFLSSMSNADFRIILASFAGYASMIISVFFDTTYTYLPSFLI